MNIGDVLRSTPLEICLTEDSVPMEGRLYRCHRKVIIVYRDNWDHTSGLLRCCPFCGVSLIAPHSAPNCYGSSTYKCGTSITITDGTYPGDIDVIVNEIKFDILHVGSERMIQCLSGLDDMI